MRSRIFSDMPEHDRYIVECSCLSPDHLLVFDFDEEYNYIDVAFTNSWEFSLWQRLIVAFKYAFGKNKYLYYSDSVGVTEDNIEDLEEVIKKVKAFKKKTAKENKKNKVVIDSCFDCNDHEYDKDDSSVMRCCYNPCESYHKPIIDDPNSIPDFCPRFKNELEF